MKHRAQDYAKAFVALALEAKTDKERDGLVKNLTASLTKNGDASLASSIVALAEQLLRRTRGGREWVIESARPLPDAEAKRLRALAGSKDAVREIVSPELIAGIRLVLDGTHELDTSLRRKLDRLFERRLATSD